MLKVVLDTNTFISGFLWDGNEAELIRLIELDKIQLFISDEIIEEIEKVLEKQKIRIILEKYDIDKNIIINKIIELSTIINPKIRIPICRDKDDNKFIECAFASKANYIVTGDSDLLVLKKYNQIEIITTTNILLLLKKINQL